MIELARMYPFNLLPKICDIMWCLSRSEVLQPLLLYCHFIQVFLLISPKGSKIFAGTDSNTVQSYLLPEGSPDGILCRFTAPVTHINLSEDGKKLVAGAG